MSDELPIGFLKRFATDGPDAVVYADREGKMRFRNASATRIFGYEPDQALGQTLDLIVPEPQRIRHWEAYHRVMAGDPSRYGEGEVLAVPAMRKDAKRISIEFTILPVNDDAGAMVGIAAFLRDVTTRFNELRSLRQELAALKAQSSRG
jgi:PAS domain S-box-containing protein